MSSSDVRSPARKALILICQEGNLNRRSRNESTQIPFLWERLRKGCNIFNAHSIIQTALDRRTLLAAGGLGFCGLHLPSLVQAAPSTNTPTKSRAKTTIL